MSNENHTREEVERRLNSIPSEFFEKFPELKEVVDLTNVKLAQGMDSKEVEEYIKTTKEYKNLEKRQKEIQDFQDELEGYDRKKDEEENKKLRKFSEEIYKHSSTIYISTDVVNITPTPELKNWCNDVLTSSGFEICYLDLVKVLAEFGHITRVGHAFDFINFVVCLNSSVIYGIDINIIDKIYGNEEKVVNFLKECMTKYKV